MVMSKGILQLDYDMSLEPVQKEVEPNIPLINVARKPKAGDLKVGQEMSIF